MHRSDDRTPAIVMTELDGASKTRPTRLRSALDTKGQSIGNNDLWIAAHAKSVGLILVTDNLPEFKRVPSLKLENWFNVGAGRE